MLLFWRFDLFWMATVQREREGRGERGAGFEPGPLW